MAQLDLTPEQQAEAQRIYEILRARADEDLRHLAELLASKSDGQLFGRTEFQVRDRVHEIGVKALETALTERKKRATGGPAAPAPTAARRPSSSAGRRRGG